MMDCLIRANLHFLRQARDLLDRLGDEAYCEPSRCFYGSSVGGHLRHCIEHYLAFLEGLPDGRVDYDARARDAAVETRTAAATAELEKLLGAFAAMRWCDLPSELQVRMDCGGDDIPWQASTPGRELQFLVSHTVHHFAMIGVICRDGGLVLEESFGVAPSTLRHRALARAADALT